MMDDYNHAADLLSGLEARTAFLKSAAEAFSLVEDTELPQQQGMAWRRTTLPKTCALEAARANLHHACLAPPNLRTTRALSGRVSLSCKIQHGRRYARGANGADDRPLGAGHLPLLAKGQAPWRRRAACPHRGREYTACGTVRACACLPALARSFTTPTSAPLFTTGILEESTGMAAPPQPAPKLPCAWKTIRALLWKHGAFARCCSGTKRSLWLKSAGLHRRRSRPESGVMQTPTSNPRTGGAGCQAERYRTFRAFREDARLNSGRPHAARRRAARLCHKGWLPRRLKPEQGRHSRTYRTVCVGAVPAQPHGAGAAAGHALLFVRELARCTRGVWNCSAVGRPKEPTGWCISARRNTRATCPSAPGASCARSGRRRRNLSLCEHGRRGAGRGGRYGGRLGGVRNLRQQRQCGHRAGCELVRRSRRHCTREQCGELACF